MTPQLEPQSRCAALKDQSITQHTLLLHHACVEARYALIDEVTGRYTLIFLDTNVMTVPTRSSLLHHTGGIYQEHTQLEAKQMFEPAS